MASDPPRAPRAGRPRTLADDVILSAALEAFSQRGFDGVSIRDLNRELGASHGMLTKRFATKDALWVGAVDRAFAAHHASLPAVEIPAGADDLAMLQLFVDVFIRTAAEHPQLQRIVNLEACVESWRVDYLFDRCIAPLLQSVRPILDRLIAAGEIHPISDRDVFFVVANGAASVFALAPLSRRFEPTDGPVQPAEYARRVTALLISALRIR